MRYYYPCRTLADVWPPVSDETSAEYAATWYEVGKRMPEDFCHIPGPFAARVTRAIPALKRTFFNAYCYGDEPLLYVDKWEVQVMHAKA